MYYSFLKICGVYNFSCYFAGFIELYSCFVNELTWDWFICLRRLKLRMKVLFSKLVEELFNKRHVITEEIMYNNTVVIEILFLN